MLIPILAQFQSPVPVNPGTVSLLTYVTQALDALTAHDQIVQRNDGTAGGVGDDFGQFVGGDAKVGGNVGLGGRETCSALELLKRSFEHP